MEIRPSADRRSPNRPAALACPRCHDTLTAVPLRTPTAVHCRCQSCGELWTLSRIDDEPLPR